MKRHNFLFIIQRYGLAIDGGAELYCRWLAEHLSKFHNITILTTCASSYITWENNFKPGLDYVNGIKVIRCEVDQVRDIEFFNRITDEILNNAHNPEDEDEWLKAQGPHSSDLITFIKNTHADFDLLFFFTYLYEPTVLGTQLAPGKCILIPTAHDEPVAYLKIYRDLFQRIEGLLYLTSAEQNFVELTFPVQGKPSLLLGTGVDIPDSTVSESDIRTKYKIPDRFLLYIGRVEAGKGCQELISFFRNFIEQTKLNVKLVLAGKQHLICEEDALVKLVGYIPDEDIKPLIEAAELIIVPSRFESLSILLLQGFASKKPVLVNGHCPVLLDHIIKSNGGLYYMDKNEFIFALDLLLHRKEIRDKLGSNGSQYIKNNYSWNSVEAKFNEFIRNF